MKKLFSLLCVLLLAGCGSNTVTEITAEPQPPAETLPAPAQAAAPAYSSRFDTVTEIILSDEGITIDDNTKQDVIFTSHDIIYYEDRDTYDSGNPYGEGTDADKHTAQEAAAHTVVNITAPGAYRLTGQLSAGQIRVDLGENAYEDPDAVVELILQDADITCSVAPAILFLNTYECDGAWSVDTAQPDVDTSAAGANLILENENTVSGSYVARIYKDAEGEKKLWKQDGAIYSYQSLNVFGPGSLTLNAANEGLDTELHLTVNGGNITILSDNDGINTNEDGVSVTTINGGNLTILAGLGAEGDGIDSNGYLVINGGTVLTSANPAADAGMDSDMGSYIHGGTVIALGSNMDWAESDSGQVTMNLQFAQSQIIGSPISVTLTDGTEVFSFTPVFPAETSRSYTGMILSAPALTQGKTYHLSVAKQQMAYAGSDVGMGRPGGMGGRPGNMTPDQIPEGFAPGEMPERPEGETMPADFDPSKMGSGRGQRPEGERGPMPDNMERPELPEGETFPAGQMSDAPREGFGMQPGESSTEFYMNDLVNNFSGITTTA